MLKKLPKYNQTYKCWCQWGDDRADPAHHRGKSEQAVSMTSGVDFRGVYVERHHHYRYAELANQVHN